MSESRRVSECDRAKELLLREPGPLRRFSPKSFFDLCEENVFFDGEDAGCFSSWLEVFVDFFEFLNKFIGNF